VNDSKLPLTVHTPLKRSRWRLQMCADRSDRQSVLADIAAEQMARCVRDARALHISKRRTIEP